MVCIAPVPSRDDELEKYVVNVVINDNVSSLPSARSSPVVSVKSNKFMRCDLAHTIFPFQWLVDP
jgi:hypothetical protein